MIYRIYSSLPSFKELEFHQGLNVLIAKKEAGATDKQTRNRAGKSSLIEIIDFLSGAKAGVDSLFRSEALVNENFGITLDLGNEKITTERTGKKWLQIYLEGENVLSNKSPLTNTEWTTLLGEKMFELHKLPDIEGPKPTFRSLFTYFIRRQRSGAFTTPEKQATDQQEGDMQVALLYLLGLDWQIASEWQRIRDREKTLRELKKAAVSGAFGSIIGKSSDLRTQVTIAEARLKEMQSQLAAFRVLPQYSELELEADQLTHQISDLSNANVIDTGSIRDLESAMHSESPPPIGELESIYSEAGISLPEVALKRYDEVRLFHESVIRNRRDYLSGELDSARQRILARDQEKQQLDERRSVIMNLLKSHGALDQFSRLQAETGRKEVEVESLRLRFSAAEQLEGTKNELDIERNRLTLRLRRDFSEQKERLSNAILAFEETSKRLYESAGSMTVD